MTVGGRIMHGAHVETPRTSSPYSRQPAAANAGASKTAFDIVKEECHGFIMGRGHTPDDVETLLLNYGGLTMRGAALHTDASGERRLELDVPVAEFVDGRAKTVVTVIEQVHVFESRDDILDLFAEISAEGLLGLFTVDGEASRTPSKEVKAMEDASIEIDPASVVVDAVRVIDVTVFDWWGEIARLYPGAEPFAVECRETDFEMRRDGTFSGQVDVSCLTKRKLRSGTISTGSILVPVHVVGAVAGAKVVILKFEALGLTAVAA